MDGAPGSASDALAGDLHNDEFMPYSDDEDGDEWDFADAPVDSLADFHASLRQNFYAIRELDSSDNAAVPEEASILFSLD